MDTVSQKLRNLEHDSLEDEGRAPAQKLVLEPTEKELRLKDAKRKLSIPEEDKWLSVDNPAIWTEL